jgi:hypothetical protein
MGDVDVNLRKSDCRGDVSDGADRMTELHDRIHRDNSAAERTLSSCPVTFRPCWA